MSNYFYIQAAIVGFLVHFHQAAIDLIYVDRHSSVTNH